MKWGATILQNYRIPAVFTSAIYAFIIFCMVVTISVPAIHVWQQINFSLSILVVSSNKAYRKIGALNRDELVVVHSLLGLVVAYFSNTRKHWLPLNNVAGQFPSRKSLWNSCPTRLSSSTNVSKQNESLSICRSCSFPISFGMWLTSLSSSDFSKGFVRLSVFFSTISSIFFRL